MGSSRSSSNQQRCPPTVAHHHAVSGNWAFVQPKPAEKERVAFLEHVKQGRIHKFGYRTKASNIYGIPGAEGTHLSGELFGYFDSFHSPNYTHGVPRWSKQDTQVRLPMLRFNSGALKLGSGVYSLTVMYNTKKQEGLDFKRQVLSLVE